jgi:pimeloyl-ACP methyl ester carboxylesterase
MQQAQINGIQIGYDVLGEGEPIAFLNGLAMTFEQFNRLPADFFRGLIRLLQVARDPQLTEKVAQLTCPVLVVYGEQDKFVAPQLNRDLARSIPNSEIVMIPDAGHAVVMEQPGLIARLVHGFVGRVS